jgi:glycosyltransferase involved in cell wall biosynthesis
MKKKYEFETSDKTDKKLNILIVTFDFPPLHGGITAYVYELAKYAAKTHNVHLLTTKPEENLPKKVDNINVYRVKSSNLGNKDPFMLLKMIFKARKIIKQKKIDVIFNSSYLFGGVVTSFTGKTPLILKHDESGFVKAATKSGSLNPFLRYLLNFPDYLIASSYELANLPRKFGVPKRKIKFVLNGVDEKKFNTKINGTKARERLGIKKDEIMVLCPRRFDPKCGVEYFVRSLGMITKKAKNMKFILAGGGYPEEKKKFLRIIESQGTSKNVIFTGFIENSKMPEYYAGSDIVVLPSLIEATSIAGLEAMATGKPLVGTSVGGIPLLIDDSITGYLVKPKNPREIAEAILKLRDKKLRLKMGKMARKKAVESFTWKIITNQLVEIFKTAIKRKKIKR